MTEKSTASVHGWFGAVMRRNYVDSFVSYMVMRTIITAMSLCVGVAICISAPARGQGITEIEETVDDFFENTSQLIGTPDMRADHNIHYRLWGGFGGSAALSKTAPLAIAGGAAFQTYNLQFAAAFIHDNGTRRTQPRYGWNEIDAMVGYATNGRDLIRFGFLPDQLTLSISAGVGWYDYSTNWRFGRGRFGAPPPVDTNTSHVNTYEWGFGVPIQLQASYDVVRYLGLGVTLFANLNPKRINYGALATVVLSYF